MGLLFSKVYHTLIRSYMPHAQMISGKHRFSGKETILIKEKREKISFCFTKLHFLGKDSKDLSKSEPKMFSQKWEIIQFLYPSANF